MCGTKIDNDEIPSVSFEEFAPPTMEEWHEEAVAALKGAPFEKRMFTKTYEGITLEPIYTLKAEELPGEDVLPGIPPYIRGAEASGYLAAPWAITQGCSCVEPGKANDAALSEIKKGAGSVHFELDRCTRLGKDPDEGLFTGDYRGVSISTLKDMDDALKNLDISSTPVHVYAGASAAPMLALLAAQAKASGCVAAAIKDYRGCVGADPLGELAAEGEVPVPPEELYDEMALSIQWAEKEMPHMKTILVRGEPYHNGGSNAAQESSFAVSTAISYIRAMRQRGIEPETTVRHMRFSFSVGANFFMEIARLRAVRAVWAQVVDSFGIEAEDAGKMDIIARTSRFTSTVYDPYVNILRTTTQAFSGALGGISSLQVGCFDEAVRPEGEISKRIARNIQIMLQTEFDMLQPVDPAGGSWYVEKLTSQIAEKIWSLIQDVETKGGMQAALTQGQIQDDIAGVFKERLKNLAFRTDKALGTNMYPNTIEQPLEYGAPCASELFAARKNAVDSYKELMDDRYAAEQLEKIMPSVRGESGDFMRAIIDAFMAGATIGEVRSVLNDGFTETVKVKAIGMHRWTEQFESLRKRTEDFTAGTGEEISIFLANMGPIPQHKARADFSTGFMEVAHFKVLKNNGFASPEEAVAAAVCSKADVAVICSTDDTYPELVPPVARGIKAACPDMKVFLAGAPAPEFKESYLEAGVDDFIHVRSNCYEILTSIQNSKEGC